MFIEQQYPISYIMLLFAKMIFANLSFQLCDFFTNGEMAWQGMKMKVMGNT